MKKAINLLLFLWIILDSAGVNSHNARKKFNCISNKFNTPPKEAKNFIFTEKEKPLFLRNNEELDEDGFKKFNIYLDLKNIENEIEDSDLSDYKDIIINSMEKAKSVFETILKVKTIDLGYNFKDEEIKELQINDWDKSKFGTEAFKKNITMNSLGIDLVIFARMEELDEDIVAHSAPKLYHKDSSQPLVGVITINTKNELAKDKSQEFFQSVMVHEFIHILGFTPYYLNQNHLLIQQKL